MFIVPDGYFQLKPKSVV